MAKCTINASVDIPTTLRLQNVAKAKGMSMSLAIRQAIGMWLDKHDPTDSHIPSHLRGYVTDASEEPDEAYQS